MVSGSLSGMTCGDFILHAINKASITRFDSGIHSDQRSVTNGPHHSRIYALNLSMDESRRIRAVRLRRVGCARYDGMRDATLVDAQPTTEA
jgi:hypothetical protein